jgi:hypothetical protein
VYGAPGSGKTTHFASAAKDERSSPVLWLDCGGNPESIRRSLEGITVITIESLVDMNPVYAWLFAKQPEKHEFVDLMAKMDIPLLKNYKSVVFDGVTELQRLVVEEVADNKDKRIGDPLNVMDQRSWGKALDKVVRFTRLMYKTLPLHIMISALEDDRMDPSGTKMRTVPWLWGQARDEVPGYALLVMRMVRVASIAVAAERAKFQNAYSVGYIDQVDKFSAKQQYGANLPAIMESPTVAALLNAIQLSGG